MPADEWSKLHFGGAELNDIRRTRRLQAVAHRGTHARKELTCPEGLGQEIIGAKVEGRNFGIFIPSVRQNDNRQG